jgi:hypothetical protein
VKRFSLERYKTLGRTGYKMLPIALQLLEAKQKGCDRKDSTVYQAVVILAFECY